MLELKITDEYPSVMAQRFIVQTKIDNGTKWDQNCPAKKEDGSLKMQLSEHVEEVNSVNNNVFYVIDEEATRETHAKNEKFAKEQRASRDAKDVSTGAVLGQIGSALEVLAGNKEPKKASTVKKDTIDQDLIDKYIKLFGEKPHHKAKKPAILAAIAKKEAEQ